MIIVLEGLMNRGISISCLLIVMVMLDAKSDSNICLLERKMQNRLFDMREAKTIFLGEINLPMAIT